VLGFKLRGHRESGPAPWDAMPRGA
jgi:hypothetical protein